MLLEKDDRYLLDRFSPCVKHLTSNSIGITYQDAVTHMHARLFIESKKIVSMVATDIHMVSTFYDDLMNVIIMLAMMKFIDRIDTTDTFYL